MRYASVCVDIPTRKIDRAFCYVVPDELVAMVQVGTTVLVDFSHRAVVGYVIALSHEAPDDVDVRKLLPIRQVLASSAFDEVAARVAVWMAKEYACPLAQALHPFLAPGQKVRVRREREQGPWILLCEKTGPVDTRWVGLTEAGRSFVPRKNAARQREVIDACSLGMVRLPELAATVPGAAAVVATLEKKGIVFIERRRKIREEAATTLSSAQALRPKKLTEGQRRALAAVDEARLRARGGVVLIDGVTGSGKTEVYLEAIDHARQSGRGALVLVPEISLTAQTVGRFRSRFGEDVAVLHSRLSAGERYDQWDLIRQGRVHVVVGARSALFAPLANLGLIVIDEEHESSYKQDSAPRYHAREVAEHLASERGCALVLGSATPSLESLQRCRVGAHAGVRWARVEMPDRPGDAVLPHVQVVDMTRQFAAGRRSIFSEPLTEGLKQIVSRHEKAVLLLNRRGFANFLMCRECGCVPECPHCSTALTYHERTHELVCHSCGRRWPIRAWPDPGTRCPNCGSRYLGAYGVGTQRVEDELHTLFASFGCTAQDVQVIRMDADTTRERGAHQRLLERFDDASCAVLLGTQMIAKGLDFPEVTLVGVINADTTLKFPDFRAAERTYDLLEQVAGRAGRGERPGEVIIQSYWSTHPAIAAVASHSRKTFLDAELAARKEAHYPPFTRLSNVIVWGTDHAEVKKTADGIAAAVRVACAQAGGKRDGADASYWEVLGPAECPRSRIKDRWRRHVLVKCPIDVSPGPLLSRCVKKLALPAGIRVAIDVDAFDLM